MSYNVLDNYFHEIKCYNVMHIIKMTQGIVGSGGEERSIYK
jgi:hypothetical protein